MLHKASTAARQKKQCDDFEGVMADIMFFQFKFLMHAPA
jgi:hypothetical protein